MASQSISVKFSIIQKIQTDKNKSKKTQSVGIAENVSIVTETNFVTEKKKKKSSTTYLLTQLQYTLGAVLSGGSPH